VHESDVRSMQSQGMTVILLADLTQKKHLGTLGFQDTLRPDAPDALAALHHRGIRIGVISGDSQPAVEAVLKNLPIDFIRAGVRPQEKAAAITELRAHAPSAAPSPSRPLTPSPRRPLAPSPPRPHQVAFVGDGINDAPALAAADLGIALAGGGGGTDIAKAAGDVLLMNNQLAAVPAVLSISARTLTIIKQNLFWAFAYNVAAIPLAMLGILPPGLAAAAMMLSSLTVVANALRLHRVKL